jgi:hypothetical protein
MTLSAATSVAFAVSGGSPADAKSWITVDLAGHPTAGRRGYIVATEPVEPSGRGYELAAQARTIILAELRRLRHSPPDVALGRSLAAANGAIFDQAHGGIVGGGDQRTLVGATAIILEGHTATLAHVPPGQLILVEDGLVYSVPELESWFPQYAQNPRVTGRAEPLGFASWTEPLMAQTEIRPGDTLVVCSAETGRAFAEEVVSSGFQVRDLAYLHHRDPDLVLDAFRGVVIAQDLPRAAAAVISFPPLPDSEQVRTLGDIGRRGRERVRHGRAIVRQWKPVPNPRRRPGAATTPASIGSTANVSHQPLAISSGVQRTSPSSSPPDDTGHPDRPTRSTRLKRARSRVARLYERGEPRWRSTWARPSTVAQFGVPGAHGVNMFRGQTSYMGEPSWRHRLPRLPVIGSAWIWPFLLLLIAGSIVGALYIREQYLIPEVDETALIAAIDERILSAEDQDAPAGVVADLDAAQEKLDLARKAGITDDLLNPRQQAITTRRDAVTDVIRMSDLQRIGTLPAEFHEASVRGVNTSAGIFFVAGNLYQWQPGENGDLRALDVILEQGRTIDNIRVGPLWGLAFDAKGLYVTDGEHVFMLAAETGAWRAVPIGKINNQPWKPGPLAAFDGSVYLLQQDGAQIYRFGIDDATGEAPPVEWLQTGARDDIGRSRDLAIDAKIFVLLDSGEVQVMYRGELESSVQPKYVEPGIAEAIVDGAATGYLYVAVMDGDNSRVVAFDRNGGTAYQLLLPAGFTTGDAEVAVPFDNLQDIVVDEATGTLYIVNGDAIWTARYSLPPLESTAPGTPAPGR